MIDVVIHQAEQSTDLTQLNSSYQQVAKISAIGEGLKADLHEMTVTAEGTALVSIYQVYQHDLSDIPGYTGEPGTGYIWDCLFQEIDIKKNELLFQWRASEHHSINESFRGVEPDGAEDSPYDWYHMNSIQKDGLGNYLVSARYTHTITYINGTTGDIIWILGGRRNSFKDLSDGRATANAWQHDARIMPLNTFPELMNDDIRANGFWEGEITSGGRTTQLVSMFDNSADDRHYHDGISRGLLLEVSYPAVGPPVVNNIVKTHNSGELSARWDEPAPSPEDPAYTVRLVKSYDHPQGIISSSQGSFQVLPNAEKSKDPKVLLGYGFNAVWTEFSADGEVLCDTHFATKYSWERGDVQSYRVFKHPWVGHPTEPPTAVLGDDSIFVSWNGATEVKTWILQHSTESETASETASEEAWTDVSSVEKRGFETEIEFDEDQAHRYLRVLGLDASGKILGISRQVDLGWTVGLTSAMPKVLDGSATTPLKMLMLFAFNITALVLLYEGGKKYFSWRRQKQWRQYRGVRLGSDV